MDLPTAKSLSGSRRQPEDPGDGGEREVEVGLLPDRRRKRDAAGPREWHSNRPKVKA